MKSEYERKIDEGNSTGYERKIERSPERTAGDRYAELSAKIPDLRTGLAC